LWWAQALLRARDRERRTADLLALVTALAACGVTVAAAVALFQARLAFRILTTSYPKAYVAFQLPYRDHLLILYEIAGPVLIMCTAAGAIRAYTDRKWRILFLLACAAFSQVMLSRTHAPEIHHTLPIFFWCFPAFVYGATWPVSIAGGRWKKAVWLLPLMTLISFASIVSNVARDRLAVLRPLLPGETAFPLKIENFPAYLNLIDDLKRETQSGGRIAVFASNVHLTGSLLGAIDHTLRRRINWVPDIDMRDGLQFSTLTADYVVATSRPALQYGRHQYIIEVLNNSVMTARGFGGAYRRILGPYAIGGDFMAYVFKRDRTLSSADIADITELIIARYPDWTVSETGLVPAR